MSGRNLHSETSLRRWRGAWGWCAYARASADPGGKFHRGGIILIVRLSEGIVPKMSIALFTLKDELVALSKALMSSDQMMKEDHGLAAKTVRVIMPAEAYPRMWKTKTVTVQA